MDIFCSIHQGLEMSNEGINGLEIKEKRLKCGRFFQLPRELNKKSGENGLFSESRTKQGERSQFLFNSLDD